LLRREHGSDDLVDQDRRVIEHAQLAVDSHPWLGARCEQQVRAVSVPKDLQPWVNPKCPALRAGHFGFTWFRPVAPLYCDYLTALQPVAAPWAS
jgi:hypothetical protein